MAGSDRDLTSSIPFYEQARELGEVTQRGLRYRLYYDIEHRRTICVLVPGQETAAGV